MQLEDYFDFESSGAIRIKGHRIWLEDILYEYIFREMTPKELHERFPTLDLERIHACLLYYHAHKELMDKYLGDWLEYCQKNYDEFQKTHADWIVDMRRRMEAHRDKLERVVA
jgi:uncharacterized protein (DUF433 family)